MRIFLSAGEASGDAYAAALVDEMRKTGGDFTFEGVGGKRLREAIGRLVADSSTWGALSISQSLKIAGRAYRGGMRARRQMRQGEPGLFVAIDFGFFNIRQCRWAKAHGWKVLYFMPPSSYHRVKQGRDLPKVTDYVVTPFPWSAEILKGIGANAFFFGHPLKQLLRSHQLEGEESENTIGVLPGSRSHELDANLPVIAELVKPGDLPTLEFALAPSVDAEEVRAEWERLAPGREDVFTQGDAYGVLKRVRAAVICSGTATLEAALVRCPHVVLYGITKSMAREGKLIGFKRPRYIALPNIVLDRDVVPEFAGLEIDAEEVRAGLEPLLHTGPARKAQLKAFAEIDTILGPNDAIAQTAHLIAQIAAS